MEMQQRKQFVHVSSAKMQLHFSNYEAFPVCRSKNENCVKNCQIGVNHNWNHCNITVAKVYLNFGMQLQGQIWVDFNLCPDRHDWIKFIGPNFFVILFVDHFTIVDIAGK